MPAPPDALIKRDILEIDKHMRHAIKGERAGSTVHVGGRFVTTHPVDGGATFSEAQLQELEARGHEVVRVNDVDPTTQRELTEAERQGEVEAQNRLAVLSSESARNAEQAQQLPKRSRGAAKQ